MIRVGHRVGRRTWMSAPLWLWLLASLFVGAALVAVAAAVAAILAAVVLVFLLVAVVAAVVGWVRRSLRR